MSNPFNDTPTKTLTFKSALLLLAILLLAILPACGIRDDESAVANLPVCSATQLQAPIQDMSVVAAFELPGLPDKSGALSSPCIVADDAFDESLPTDSALASRLTVNLDRPLESLKAPGALVVPEFSPDTRAYELTVGFFSQEQSLLLNGDRDITVPLSASGPTAVSIVSPGRANNASQSVEPPNTENTQVTVVRRDVSGIAERAILTDSFQRIDSAFGSRLALSSGFLAVLGEPDENRLTVYRNVAADPAPSSLASDVPSSSQTIAATTSAVGVASDSALVASEGMSTPWVVDSRLMIRGDTVVLNDELMVVGNTQASGRNLPGLGVGGVTVFVRQDDQWVMDAELRAPLPSEGNRFGAAVAVSGDLIVVGAPGDRSLATGINGDETPATAYAAGAVHVFERNAGGWTRLAYLKGRVTSGGDRFGAAVAIDKNLIAVGATGDESAATGIAGNDSDSGIFGAGAVTIFTRDALGAFVQSDYLKPRSVDALDGFGQSLALQGNTLVVSAVDEDGSVPGVDADTTDNRADGSGAVSVFLRVNGQWQQQAFLKASNPDRRDQFGQSISLHGNLLAVSAVGEDGGDGGVNADALDNTRRNGGAVYLFQRRDNRWQQDAILRPSAPQTGSGFGLSLSLGRGALAVGAPFRTGPGGVSGGGAVFVYR